MIKTHDVVHGAPPLTSTAVKTLCQLDTGPQLTFSMEKYDCLTGGPN